MNTLRPIAILMVLASTTFAHRNLHEWIDDVGERLEHAVGAERGALLLVRGDMHRRHGDHRAAAADLAAAAPLAADSAELWLQRGLLQAAMGSFAPAEGSLSRAVALRPTDEVARVQRAKVLTALGKTQGAADDYRELLRQAPRRLEYYLQLASVLKSVDPAAARAVLDEGIVRVGPVPQLQEPAVRAALAAGDTARALGRLEVMIALNPGAAQWQVWRAEVLAPGDPAAAEAGRQARELLIATTAASPLREELLRRAERLVEELGERKQPEGRAVRPAAQTMGRK